MPTPTRAEFLKVVKREAVAARAGVERGRTDSESRCTQSGSESRCTRLAVPVFVSLLDDQLTPVVAYRRLVAPDARQAPSFLLESVEGGERQGRHSILGAQPRVEVVGKGGGKGSRDQGIVGSGRGKGAWQFAEWVEGAKNARGRGLAPLGSDGDPLDVARRMTRGVRLVRELGLPGVRLPKCFLGGWVGYAAYDTVRYAEPSKLGWESAPRDDRGLADVDFGFYDGVVVFDHVEKLVHVVQLAEVRLDAKGRGGGVSDAEAGRAYDAAVKAIERRVKELKTHSEPMTAGRMERPAGKGKPGGSRLKSNLTKAAHAKMVARAKEYIAAGDVFQVVVGQRFERESAVDPFDVYRALRAVNPSPYMVYLQGRGCILVASSPEILCRVRRKGSRDQRIEGSGEERFEVTNRPLAGTRRRGKTPEEDAALEKELLADPKERAEHVMLVDLGRNDVGVVARAGTVALAKVMEVERYSHVMHISSTVTGELREGLDCWDALRAALPVGTISGAPKIRAMQIIDELEPVRRGPYGGGMGYVGLDGEMDIALALRTMVVRKKGSWDRGIKGSRRGKGKKTTWVYHLQAAGGIVADSVAGDEYQETVNKSAALARAIEVAEGAF